MRLLVLGGSIFLGRHVVQAALDRGHEVVMFQRGQHGRELFPDVPRLIGDRDGNVTALSGRQFDAVIDCSGYTPDQVVRSAQAIAGHVAHYVFISSISIYASFPPGQSYDESAPVQPGSVGYGALKARSEEAIEAALPGCVAQVRPGLIVGPHDPTGRFTYWPLRVERGGEVLAPGRPQRPVQFIDARDLAKWCVDLAERRTVGVFNAVGPQLTMLELLDTCREVSGSGARFRWLADDVLLDKGIEPWTALPLWIPEHDASFGGMLLAVNRRATDAGLTFLPLRATIRDTLAWAHGCPEPATEAVKVITPDCEAECLSLPG